MIKLNVNELYVNMGILKNRYFYYYKILKFYYKEFVLMKNEILFSLIYSFNDVKKEIIILIEIKEDIFVVFKFIW